MQAPLMVPARSKNLLDRYGICYYNLLKNEANRSWCVEAQHLIIVVPGAYILFPDFVYRWFCRAHSLTGDR